MNKKFPKFKSFTLVELLLYIALATMIISTISAFLALIMQSRIKNQTIAEVEQQGKLIIDTMTQTLRNSNGVSSPEVGATSASLNLQMADASKNPTIFDSADGTIRIKEGVAETINLLSNLVSCSNLSFSNLSRSNTPGVIKIQFTLSYINNDNKNEHNYSRAFSTSVSVRK